MDCDPAWLIRKFDLIEIRLYGFEKNFLGYTRLRIRPDDIGNIWSAGKSSVRIQNGFCGRIRELKFRPGGQVENLGN